MYKEVLNALIIGAGNIGTSFDEPGSPQYTTHAHAYTDHPGFKLVGIIDTNKTAGKKASQKWLTSYYPTIEEAFTSQKIDVVSIAVPDDFHFAILKELVNFKPRFVLTEKPLTKLLDEANEIVELYNQYEIPAIINYKRRFVPEFITLKKEIDDQIWGKFVLGTAYYGKGLLHNGSHLLDLLVYLLGSDWNFSHYLDEIKDYHNEDPSITFILKNKDGCNFIVQSLDCNYYELFEFDIFFERGRINITNTGLNIEKYRTNKDIVFKSYNFLQKCEVLSTQLNKSLFFTVDHIYNYLLNGGDLICKLEDGCVTMKLINLVTGK